MRVALFKTNFLGDNVVFLPVVQELRRRFPEWRLTLVTAPAVAPLYQADVSPAELLLVEPRALKHTWRSPWSFARWWRTLAKREFDASLVSYDQSSTAHALAWLAGGRARVGGSGLRIRLQGTLTDAVPWQPGWSIAQWNWEIARRLVVAFGARDWPASPPAPNLSHLAGNVTRVPGRVVIHAGSKWAYTRWPHERYVELANRLAEHQEVFWVKAPHASGAGLSHRVRLVNTPDLSALVASIASAGLFVGNNSGPMHVANALATPLVAITGPTDTTWDPQWHRHSTTVLRIPTLVCQPCDRVQHAAGRCLNSAEPLACLRAWSVPAVEEICRLKLHASAVGA